MSTFPTHEREAAGAELRRVFQEVANGSVGGLGWEDISEERREFWRLLAERVLAAARETPESGS